MSNRIIRIVLKKMEERNIGELLAMVRFYQNCNDREFKYIYQLDTLFK